MTRRRVRKAEAALRRALGLPPSSRRRSRRTKPAPAAAAARVGQPAPTRPAVPETPTGRAGKSPVARKPRARKAGTWHSHRFVGTAGIRPYTVYVPPGLRRNTRAPLLVLLHGCGQRAGEFAAATRFNEVAGRHGFVVAYPEQPAAYNRHRCWNWFERRHQARGTGEPAILAALTAQVVAETTRWRIDPERVYVAGLSAGGAMALVLGATYPDLYAAVAVHSAPPYGSASSGSSAMRVMAGRSPLPPRWAVNPSGRRIPPMIIFQGNEDTTVRAVNAQRVAEQWLAFQQAHVSNPKDPDRITRSRTSTRLAGGRRYTVTRWYTARGRTWLEAWHVDGLGHAWSGGRRGGSFSDHRGPRASTAMWRFLSAHRLAAPAQPADRKPGGELPSVG
jgi:poly(hydroxyalkanoate) depolymerase family esterase